MRKILFALTLIVSLPAMSQKADSIINFRAVKYSWMPDTIFQTGFVGISYSGGMIRNMDRYSPENNWYVWRTDSTWYIQGNPLKIITDLFNNLKESQKSEEDLGNQLWKLEDLYNALADLNKSINTPRFDAAMKKYKNALKKYEQARK
jgi:hypothetical protein